MTLRIAETRDITTCLALREEVFIHEQNISVTDERDGLDDQAIHMLAHDEVSPIGTARILLKGEVGKIGRVCVLPSHRGQGIGAAIIRSCLDTLRPRPGITRAVLGSQTHAIPFYQGLGFVAYTKGVEF